MQRVTLITVGLTLLLALALVGLVVRGPSAKSAKAVPSARPEASAKAALADPAPAAASAEFPDLLAPMIAKPVVGFDILPDGSKAPPVPDTAPQTVRFGAILFSYQGAEYAPPAARTKDQARERALGALEEAKKDFAAAVARGDQGSRADMGKMYRGILEPAAEYVLFTLPKGEVSQPVDTPRGYWIVRRNE